MSEEEPAEGRTATSDDVWDRETAPQSPYSIGQVGVGFVVLAIVGAVAYGLPILLA